MLLFKVKLLIFIFLLCTPNVKAKCSVQKITKEVVKVLLQIQNDTSENLENMYSTTSDNLQNMYSTTSDNLQNMQNASSMNMIETLRWRDELSEIMTNMFNQTMNMIAITGSNNFLATEIASLKQDLNELRNITTQISNVQSNEISFIKDSLNETNIALTGLTNSTTYTLDIHSDELSTLQGTLNATNIVLEEIKNTTEYLISILNNTTPEPVCSTPEPVPSTSEPVSSTPEPVPSGFTTYNGRIVLLPTALGGTTLSWQGSIDRCSSHGATPFIPRNLEDFRYIQQVNSDIGSGKGIWLPASDLVSEGEVNWFDGTDASEILKTFDWYQNNGVYPGDNADGSDCVNIYTSWDNKLEFDPCTRAYYWGIICERV